VVDALAARWELEPAFTEWLDAAVPFCNTLVDRIVPGAPPAADHAALEQALGYRDALLTTCEPYRLFAIEAPAQVRGRLAFAAADPGVVLTDDVRPFRERKVRMLNGAHTALVSAAILAGCETVREAVEHPRVGPFLRQLLFDEIVPTVDAPGAAEFARATLDRFANPYVRHALWDITLQGTMKARVRVAPSVARFADMTGAAPPALAFGVAAYLAFARGTVQTRRRAAGLAVPADDQLAVVQAHWASHLPALPAEVDGTSPRADAPAAAALAPFVRAALGDAALWGTNLAALPGVTDAVTDALARLLADGADRALAALPTPPALSSLAGAAS
jgi:tagaturonate reductase